jgi:hemerythrin-like metal-binding protein
MSVIWEESYNIGIASIDEQHKKFLHMIDELTTAISENRQKTKMISVLKELEEYAEMHFSLEEAYFERFKYEESEEHKREHHIFRNNLRNLRVLLKKDDADLLYIHLLDLMESWFFKHIQGEDRKYVALLKANGVE